MRIYKLLIPPIILFIILSAVSLYLSFYGIQDSLMNQIFSLMINIMYLYGFFISILGITRYHLGVSTMGKSIMYIGGAFLVYFIADSIWTYYSIVLYIDIPYPSVADIFYILFYPMIMLGFLTFLQLLHQKISWKIYLEAIIISCFILFVLMGISQIHITEIFSSATRLLDFLYVFFDVLLFGFAYTGVRIGGGELKPILVLMAIGMFLEAVSDTLFTLANNNGWYFNGSFYDMVYILAFLVECTAVVQIIQRFSFKDQ
jgi:hypothetical protein